MAGKNARPTGSQGELAMYASIRDAIITHAGYGSLKEGMRGLDLWALEIAVDRSLTASAMQPTPGDPAPVLNSPAAIAAYSKELENHGARAATLFVAQDFNAEDMEAEVKWVADVVRIAEAMGVPAVRIDSIMSGERELPLEERVDTFARGVTAVLEATAGSQVALGMENHGYQGNDPDFTFPLLEKVGSERFGMTLDTGNFYWWGHPLDTVYEIMERLAPMTKHTHLKNISYPEEVRQTQREIGWKYGEYVAPIPDGDVDHARVVQMLQAAGYEGDLCIEDESLGKFQVEERQAVLRREVDHIRELMGG
ncbi:MAG: sugar phosphate isomerase/epimerase family protein [Armatimonadota bacterium]